MTRYARIARAVLSRPWAIKKDSVEWAAVMDVLEARVSGSPFSEEEIEARLAAVPRRTVAAAADDDESRVVAVLPIHGVLMPRANLMSMMSGGTSVTQLSAAFAEAVNDERVQAIVLDVDSPGGLVDGIPEFAAQIREARGSKPIVAVADTMAASAAYWLATQADELSVTPSGEVGSIGVFSAHEDASKFYDALGVKTTLISAGKYKTEGNEFEPLGEDAEAHLQAIVDDYYGMFVADVAKGRGVKAADVRKGYGEGRVFTASMAKDAGMVDRVETLGQAIERVSRSGGRRRGRSALEDIGGVRALIDSATATGDASAAIAYLDAESADEQLAEPEVIEAAAEADQIDQVTAEAGPAAGVSFEVELARHRAEQRRHRTS